MSENSFDSDVFDGPVPRSLDDLPFAHMLMLNELMLPHTNRQDVDTLMSIVDVSKLMKLLEKHNHFKRRDMKTLQQQHKLQLEQLDSAKAAMKRSNDVLLTKLHEMERESKNLRGTIARLLVENETLISEVVTLKSWRATVARDMDTAHKSNAMLAAQMVDMQRMHQLEIVKLSVADQAEQRHFVGVPNETDKMSRTDEMMDHDDESGINDTTSRGDFVDERVQAHGQALKKVHHLLVRIDGIYDGINTVKQFGEGEASIANGLEVQRALYDQIYKIQAKELCKLSEESRNLRGNLGEIE